MAYWMYIDKILFPVTPGKIDVKINNKNETVSLINEGEVNVIKKPGLTDITIDKIILPTVTKYPFAVYENDQFQPPAYYLDKLESIKKSKKPHTFLLLGTPLPGNKDAGKIPPSINMDVTVEDYTITRDADEDGLDITLSLNLKQYRYAAPKMLVPKSSKKAKKLKRTSARVTKSVKAKTYVVKKGDTLYNIARKQLGDGSLQKEIYSLNKKLIDKEAAKYNKEHPGKTKLPNLLTPGMRIKLPAKG